MSDIFDMRDKEWCEALLAEKAKKIVELQAEIERLRAALREIAEENIGNTAAISVYTARAALEGRDCDG